MVTRVGRRDYFDACLVYYNTDQARERGVQQSIYDGKRLKGYGGLKISHLPRWYNQTQWIQELNELSRSGEKGTILVDRPHERREDRRLQYYTSRVSIWIIVSTEQMCLQKRTSPL